MILSHLKFDIFKDELCGREVNLWQSVIFKFVQFPCYLLQHIFLSLGVHNAHVAVKHSTDWLVVTDLHLGVAAVAAELRPHPIVQYPVAPRRRAVLFTSTRDGKLHYFKDDISDDLPVPLIRIDVILVRGFKIDGPLSKICEDVSLSHLLYHLVSLQE